MEEPDPYPSGGSAAAQVAALAAAVAAAAADRSRERWDQAGGARAQAQALQRRAVELAERDQRVYALARRALAQRGQPADGEPSEENQPATDWRLGCVLEAAAGPPLELAASAADIAQLAGMIALQGADEVRADAVIAADLAATAARSAARLVQINLVVGGDRRMAAIARGYADAAASAAASADAIDL